MINDQLSMINPKPKTQNPKVSHLRSSGTPWLLVPFTILAYLRHSKTRLRLRSISLSGSMINEQLSMNINDLSNPERRRRDRLRLTIYHFSLSIYHFSLSTYHLPFTTYRPPHQLRPTSYELPANSYELLTGTPV
jgi:hypothetical protein